MDQGTVMRWKDMAKKSPMIYAINARWKCFELKQGLAKLTRDYQRKEAKSAFQYDASQAVEQFKRSHSALRSGFIAQAPGKLRIFYVGTTQSQDESGFLQGLRRLADVVVFHNVTGKYGIWVGDQPGGTFASFDEIRRANDQALLDQLRHAHDECRVDVLMGQMWANYTSAGALAQVRQMGIPVINIAMDDRLPNHWSWRGDIRLGSVGLWPSVDIVLTTCADTCSWYGIEGCPALFWPLASDATLFGTAPDSKRDIDVLFIGNRYGVRGKIIAHLQRQGIAVDCYGGGWPNGYVNAEQMISLSKRARIILGIGSVGHCADVYTLKLRDFDAMMTGALYVTHRNRDLTRLFREGEEIEYYESPQEAAEKIRHYLDHPEAREKIGQRGMQTAMARDTWDQRLGSTFVQLGLLTPPTTGAP